MTGADVQEIPTHVLVRGVVVPWIERQRRYHARPTKRIALVVVEERCGWTAIGVRWGKSYEKAQRTAATPAAAAAALELRLAELQWSEWDEAGAGAALGDGSPA